MRLSTQSRYGVKAVFDIGYHGGGAGVQTEDLWVLVVFASASLTFIARRK